MLRIGIDTGGTFTDFVVLDQGQISIFKLPSTPDQPEKAVLEGLSRIVQEREGFLIQYGSTVATNALLERKGARTLLVTNQGFEDLLEIGRQNRPALYKLSGSRPEPLVPARFRVGIKERTQWDGSSLVPLENKSLDWLRGKVEQLRPESIAVVLLYSYVNPESELRIAQALESAGLPISLSHKILPEFREYERTSTTVVNAYVTPIVTRYLSALSSHPLVRKGKLTVMQSNGGSIPADSASLEPVRTLLSGPAGGVVGGFEIARQSGYDRVITFDMGGTSTDVCLCNGGIETTNEASIDYQPVSVQMIRIHTVGAGGGSVAWIDPGGLLRVGPESAGADPGPLCYGKGSQLTVTDAHLFLGRMEPDYFLGGEIKLYPDRILPALESLGQDLSAASGRAWGPAEIAEGVIRIANAQMERALRVISLQKGYDTREFTLVTFGGAGGLHACDLARSLMIPRVLVPLHPGILSAQGILMADVVKDTSLTVLLHSSQEDLLQRLEEAYRPLEERVRQQLGEEGFSPEEIRLEKSLDLRYPGQSYELNLPYSEEFLSDFHELHEQFYGYANPRLPVEIVNIRVRGSARYGSQPLPRHELSSEEPPMGAMIQEKQVTFGGDPLPTRFYLRGRLKAGNYIPGPAVILEYSATTLVPPDFEARIDPFLNIIIEPRGNGA